MLGAWFTTPQIHTGSGQHSLLLYLGWTASRLLNQCHVTAKRMFSRPELAGRPRQTGKSQCFLRGPFCSRVFTCVVSQSRFPPSRTAALGDYGGSPGGFSWPLTQLTRIKARIDPYATGLFALSHLGQHHFLVGQPRVWKLQLSQASHCLGTLGRPAGLAIHLSTHLRQATETP